MATAAQAPVVGDAEAIVTVLRMRFRSEDTGFAVCDANGGPLGAVVVCGLLGQVDKGDRLWVRGRFERHRTYGLQLRAAEIRHVDPDDRAGMLRYLASIRHLGPTRAEQLLDRHGSDVYARVDADPAGELGALRGVGARRAEEAADCWVQRRHIRSLYELLAPHGLARLAEPLRRRYGDRAADEIRTDPYQLTEVHGVGFRTADRIAQSAGIPADSSRRAHAAIVHCLLDAEQLGHAHLPQPALLNQVGALVGDTSPARVEELALRQVVVIDCGRVYRTSTHRAERWVAAAFTGLASSTGGPDADPGPVPQGGLTDEQWAGVRAALTSRLSVITGGPGTGKTFAVRQLVAQARRRKLRVGLCAPSGLAARRLATAAGQDAFTVHKLLEWGADEPGRHSLRPLECDLLVVDEASMVNLRLMLKLLDAVGAGTHMVLIGDPDQLPPIGAGRPFADLIASDAVPVARLSRNFRNDSMIVLGAHAINAGRLPSFTAGPGVERNLFFCARADAQQGADEIVNLACERLPSHYGVDAVRDVQVLAAVKDGAMGVHALNERLRERLNPDGARLANGLRIADKLVVTRNDEQTGLRRSQIVFAKDACDDGVLVELDTGDVVLVPTDRLRLLAPAFCGTVHRFQGSQAPVIVVAARRSRVMSRNLLYTAVTRAQRACVLVGDRRAIVSAVANAEADRRHSGLADRIAGTPVSV